MYCASCGAPNPDGSQHCSACGVALISGSPDPAAGAYPPAPADFTPAEGQSSVATAYAPSAVAVAEPLQPVAVSAPALSGPDRSVAGYRVCALGDRLIAMILDTLLLVGVACLVGSAAGAHWAGDLPSGAEWTSTGLLITLGVSLLVGFVYYWLCEGLLGLTLGKVIAGVKLINANGAPCGLGPSLIRNILRIIDGQAGYLVGYFIAIFSRLRQRLGDHLANTYVIEQEPRALYRILFVVLWIVLVGASYFSAYTLHK